MLVTHPRPSLSRPQLPEPSRRSLASRIALMAATTLGLLVLLEIGFRIHDVIRFGLPFFWDPARMSTKRTELCNPFLLFRGAACDWSTRLRPAERTVAPNGRKVIRIVCLGGSTTEDATAFFEERVTYPLELERVLNEKLTAMNEEVVVETINAGFAGHSSLHALILLETELVQLKPDIVIIYENINDLLVNYFAGPTNPAYARKFLHNQYLPPELRISEEPTLLDHSRLYSWGRDGLRKTFWYRLSYRQTDEPIELTDAETFRTSLRNIAAVAKANGAKVMFGQQAMTANQELFEKHFRSKTYNTAVCYPRIEQLGEHFRTYNGIVRQVAAEQGAPCADPYGVLKERPELFVDVVHLHAEGARLVGREFARCMIESGMLDELVQRKRHEPRMNTDEHG